MQNSNQINDIISKQNWTPTPFYKATSLSHKLNLNLWLKREDCTPIGSFKIRGAFNKLLNLKEDGILLSKNEKFIKQKEKQPIYACSAGNHAQGVSLTCSSLNINHHMIHYAHHDYQVSKKGLPMQV